MSYIAFLDMLGTRAAAAVSNAEYKRAIKAFHKSMNDAASFCKGDCKIFGYSDNAYIEIEEFDDIIVFFRELRQLLLEKHLYFSAAIAPGSLGVDDSIVKTGNQGYSMVFTATEAIQVYRLQCAFSGIGITVSNKIIKEIENISSSSDFCNTIFQPLVDSNHYECIYDISYKNIVLEEIEYIIADYITTNVMDKRAGRYYITPIISVIKCIDEDIIINKREQLVRLITAQSIPNDFSEELNKDLILLFVFALLDRSLCLYEKNMDMDINVILQHLIECSEINIKEFIKKIPSIKNEIVSEIHKKQILKCLYNMSQDNKK